MQGRTLVPVHPSDPAPFAALPASTSGLLNDTHQLVVFSFHAWRFQGFSSYNALYPIYAVAVLTLFVFWLPEDNLEGRLQLVAALFLSLVGE